MPPLPPLTADDIASLARAIDVQISPAGDRVAYAVRTVDLAANPRKLVERSPLSYADRVRTPLLILHAERDLCCPIEQAEQFLSALKLHGREAVFVRFPEDNRDLSRGGKPRNRIEHCRRTADWFDAHR